MPAFRNCRGAVRWLSSLSQRSKTASGEPDRPGPSIHRHSSRARISSQRSTGSTAYEDAAAAYREALSRLPAPDDQTLGRILDAGYQLRAAVPLAEIGQVRELETELAESEQAIESTAAVIERLETELAENQDERDGLTTELSGS